MRQWGCYCYWDKNSERRKASFVGCRDQDVKRDITARIELIYATVSENY